MDVHVYVFGRHVKIDKIGHLLALGHQAVKGCDNGLVKIRVLHVAAVDEEILRGVLLACRFGLAHKAAQLADGGVKLQRQQILVEAFTHHVDDALAQRSRLQTEHLGTVAVKGERHVGIDKRYALKGGDDVFQLGAVAFQELTAGRHIEKQVLDVEVAAFRTRARLLRGDLGAGDRQVGAHLVAGTARLQFDLCHGSHRCQRLATKAHGVKREEILCLRDL